MLKGFRQKNDGFTLLEMLVSMTVLSMIIGLVLVNYRVANNKNELTAAAQELVGNIRLAQSYAIGSRKYGASVPPGGWGLYFNNATAADRARYLLFADSDGGSNKLEEYVGIGGSIDIIYKTVALPANIIIDSAVDSIKVIESGGSLHTASSQASLVFLPPDPVTYINDHNNSETLAQMTDNLLEIRLKDRRTNLTKTIKVNFFGSIDVD